MIDMKSLTVTNRKSALWVLIAVSLLLAVSVFAATYNRSSRDEVGNIEIVPISLDHKTYGNALELKEDSHTVLAGVVVDDGITKRGASPGRSGDGKEIPGIVRTEYSVKVDKLYKGDTDEGKTIAVVLTGGTIDGQKYEIEGIPQLVKGEEMLMYLSKGEDGKYYPMSGSTAIAVQKADGSYSLGEDTIGKGGDVTFTEQDLIQ